MVMTTHRAIHGDPEPSQRVGIPSPAPMSEDNGMSSRAAVERDLIRRCHGGLNSADIRQEVLQLLRQLMPIDAAFFATTDPETLLFTSAWIEEPLAAATAQFLD